MKHIIHQILNCYYPPSAKDAIKFNLKEGEEGYEAHAEYNKMVASSIADNLTAIGITNYGMDKIIKN